MSVMDINYAMETTGNYYIFALSELSCVLVTNENMGLCLYMHSPKLTKFIQLSKKIINLNLPVRILSLSVQLEIIYFKTLVKTVF